MSVMLILSTGPLHVAVAVAPEPLPPVIVMVGMLVYPDPPLTTLIPVTVPDVITADADACSSADAPPPVIDTMGSVVYPLPPLVTFIAVTDPFTVTVAAAVKPSYAQVS